MTGALLGMFQSAVLVVIGVCQTGEKFGFSCCLLYSVVLDAFPVLSSVDGVCYQVEQAQDEKPEARKKPHITPALSGEFIQYYFGVCVCVCVCV